MLLVLKGGNHEYSLSTLSDLGIDSDANIVYLLRIQTCLLFSIYSIITLVAPIVFISSSNT